MGPIMCGLSLCFACWPNLPPRTVFHDFYVNFKLEYLDVSLPITHVLWMLLPSRYLKILGWTSDSHIMRAGGDSQKSKKPHLSSRRYYDDEKTPRYLTSREDERGRATLMLLHQINISLIRWEATWQHVLIKYGFSLKKLASKQKKEVEQIIWNRGSL